MRNGAAPERIGYGITWVLALIGVVAAVSRYLLPDDLHLSLAKIFYRAYAVDQFPVLAAHGLNEFIHRVGGALYMVLGVVQFLPGIRSRHPRYHRIAGRAFVVLGLAACSSGMIMAVYYPYEGRAESIVTCLFGALFIYCTVKAVVHARRHEFAAHREWIVRGFAIGLGIATIRIIVLLFFWLTDLTAREIVVPAFLSGWTISLLLGEWWIRHTRSGIIQVGGMVHAAVSEGGE